MKSLSKMKSLKERRKIEKECDELWSKIVRSTGECQRCGKKTALQAAHIISRKHKLFRWDLRNGLCLCVRCHLYWQHREPVEFTEWLKTNYPEKYRLVLEKDKITGRVDIEKVREELRSNPASGVKINGYRNEIEKNINKLRNLNKPN